MTLPMAGTGIPVIMVSPKELMMGRMLSPVRVLVEYPTSVFKSKVMGAGFKGAKLSVMLCFSLLQ